MAIRWQREMRGRADGMLCKTKTRFGRSENRRSIRGESTKRVNRRSENRRDKNMSWVNVIAKRDERKGRWNAVRDKNKIWQVRKQEKYQKGKYKK